MSINTTLQKFFRGYLILDEVDSLINGRIQVVEDILGRRRLVVRNITQSGGVVEEIWKEGLRQVTRNKLQITYCLILGLGAGSAAKLVSQFYPEVKITGIEIDQEIIKLGKKYFDLSEIPDLEIQVDDATKIINHQSRYDLILIDLYLGDQVPAGAEAEEFLKNIKKCLTDNGIAIFNRLYYGKKKEETDKFGHKLKNFFLQIETKKTPSNKLFFCRR